MMNQIVKVMRRPLVRTVVSTGNTLRAFSSKGGDGGSSSALSAGMEWRKKQLDKLENKFPAYPVGDDWLVNERPMTVESEEDLQPMWSSMESRVKNRRSRTKEQLGGKSGRRNIKRTDEELRLEAGFYDHPEEEKPEK
jgi:hypothetical protein